jgi:hypothetical protein
MRHRRRLQFLHETFTAPNPDNVDGVIEPVDDAKRMVDDFAKLSEAELGHHTTTLGTVTEPADLVENLAQQALTHMAGLSFDIPEADLFQVGDR